MTFADRLKESRMKCGISQKALAEKAGIHYRSIQNWECGNRKPNNLETIIKVAKVLGVSADSLLGESDRYVIEANEKGGSKAAQDIEKLVNEVAGLFAGGELDDDEKEGIIEALNQAYWIAKVKNKKYTPKKYLKDHNGNSKL